MPTILIVEDEPAAGRYLRSLIEKTSVEYTVIGIAKNGLEALEMVRNLEPDLVITDVKMPIMDGLELVLLLNQEFPALPVVILSGHKEFDYVRRALATGVVEYLVKPVNPVQLREILDRLGLLIVRRLEAKRVSLLSAYLRGQVAGGKRGTDVGLPKNFWLAIVRNKGLPSRFQIDSSNNSQIECNDQLFVRGGRDACETILLGSEDQMDHEIFVKKVLAISGQVPSDSFRTIFFNPGAVAIGQLQVGVRKACADLDRLIVVGLTAIHYGSTKMWQGNEWDVVIGDRIEFALRESRADLLEHALIDLVAKWQAECLPLVSVETNLRDVIHFIVRKAAHTDVSVMANLEFIVDNTISEAQNFDDISHKVVKLIAQVVGSGNPDFRNSDIPSFFNTILQYIDARYASQLTLGTISEHFRISPSYMSKLFRQHARNSFNEYLKKVRIEAAKRLISETPSMPLKDVGDCVGIQDPYYFSRVFKTTVGLSPSEYARSVKK